MKSFLSRLWNDQIGQDLIEYALLVALVATGSAILLPTAIHTGMSHIYSKVVSCLDRFGSGGG
jgi:Flp pilus assembly pilin Flp